MIDTLARGGPALPWHDDLWQQVAGARRQGRTSHGLLVCGPPGVGKRRFAGRLARALLCHAPGENGDACGHCDGCRQWANGAHPDVSILVPEQAEAAIRVDPMRAFTDRLHLTAQYETGRLGWIDPAEQLNAAAANSLLKTLEEPAAGTHLILVSDHFDRLLPTIRSRCSLLRVPPAPVAVARDWLIGQGVDVTHIDDDALRMPLRWMDGPGASTAALEEGWRHDLAMWLSGRADPVAVAERWAEQPPELLIEWLYRTACALVRFRLTGSGLQDDSLVRCVPGVPAAVLERLSARVSRVAYLEKTNANWQLVIESLLLGCAGA